MANKSYIHFERNALYRICNDPDLKNPDKPFLIYCITKANFTTAEAKKGTIVHRGSFVTSTEEIMKALNIVDWRTYERIRVRLKAKGYISYYTDIKGTIFYIKNYESYVRPVHHTPPVESQYPLLQNHSSKFCKITEPISIHPAVDALPPQDEIEYTPNSHPRAASLESERVGEGTELARPSDSINHNIVSLNGKQINKDSDYFKQLNVMYGDYTDTWGFLVRTFKWVKDKKFKVNDVEKFVESQLRKEKDRVVDKMFMSKRNEDELQ